MRKRFLSFCLLLGMAGSAFAAEEGAAAVDPQKAALQFSQSAIGRQVGDYALLDRSGKPVKLSDYRGKPLIIHLIYTGCSDTCPATTQFLAKSIKEAQDALRYDAFSIVSISFNAPWDTPQTMRDFAVRQNIDLPNWEFLSSPDAATVERLARDLGFTYKQSPKGFDHIAQLTIVDPEGRVFQQVYGDEFDIQLLVQPMKQLLTGRRSVHTTSYTSYSNLEGIGNRIRLFCTIYDPKTKTYIRDYSFFGGLAISAVMVFYFLWWIIKEARRSPSRRRASPPSVQKVKEA